MSGKVINEPIKTDSDYKVALNRLELLFDAKGGTPESDEADILAIMIDDYENKHFPIKAPDPIEAIKIRMEEMQLKQVDLLAVIKMKLKYIGIGILGVTLIIGFITPLFNNLWGVLTDNAYIIPKESSIFTFTVSKMNDGSGDYWLYGEDNNYFYSKMQESENASYIKILKQEAKKVELFNKTNFKTWDNEFLCGDLLEIYAEKPENLEFVSCEKVSNSQTIVRATYRVSGNQSKEIEDFLVGNYRMGKLKWICCGWESGGKYGSFEDKELTKIHPFLTNIITMYGSGFDRNKIDYFIVTVELIIV